MSAYGPYKIRKSRNNRQITYSVGLPVEIGQPLAGQRFMVEVTDEGILFRPAPLHTDPEENVVEDPNAAHLATLFQVSP